jgi:hypothetical protein
VAEAARVVGAVVREEVAVLVPGAKVAESVVVAWATDKLLVAEYAGFVNAAVTAIVAGATARATVAVFVPGAKAAEEA